MATRLIAGCRALLLAILLLALPALAALAQDALQPIADEIPIFEVGDHPEGSCTGGVRGCIQHDDGTIERGIRWPGIPNTFVEQFIFAVPTFTLQTVINCFR